MELTWLRSLLLGLVTGMAEILPVSAQAHRAVLMQIFGIDSDSFLLRLFTHTAVFLAVFAACRPQLRQLGREKKLVQTPKRRRKRQPDWAMSMDLRLLRGMSFWLIPGLVIYFATAKLDMKLNVIAGLLLLNAVILFIPSLLPQANKDARMMSRLDTFLFGFSAVLGYLPGVSRTGAVVSAATARGVDKPVSLKWALVLTLPAMVLLAGTDIYGMITAGIGIAGFEGVLMALLSAAAAFAGAFLAIRIMQFLAEKAGYHAFAFYSIGAALFTFIIYLTT